MRRWKVVTTAVIGAAVGVLSCAGSDQGVSGTSQAAVRFERRVPWTGKGQWLKTELHTHTRFTDGRHTVEEVVAEAVKHGCDVVAITDHADSNLGAATADYVSALDAARRRFPDIVILTGLEWNIPPAKGRDHATVLFPPMADELGVLAGFKKEFDDYKRPGDSGGLDEAGLRFLERSSPGAVVVLNHPSRKVAASADVLPWMRRWRGVNAVVIGFEGAPGHQRATPLGAYGAQVKPLDRWDPVVAEVGGVWDQLLAEGLDIWAASASADFHEPKGDYWPGQFAETWVYAADRTATSVLSALAAGRYFASHGGFARQAEVAVAGRGLPRKAVSGESVGARAGDVLDLSVQARPAETDLAGAPGRIDGLELIAVSVNSGARVVASGPPNSSGGVHHQLSVPADGVVVRARGWQQRGDERLWFYTNPIRVVTGTPGRASPQPGRR